MAVPDRHRAGRADGDRGGADLLVRVPVAARIRQGHRSAGAKRTGRDRARQRQCAAYLRRNRRRRAVRPGLCPCPGPAVADADHALDRAGPPVRGLRPAHPAHRPPDAATGPVHGRAAGDRLSGCGKHGEIPRLCRRGERPPGRGQHRRPGTWRAGTVPVQRPRRPLDPDRYAGHGQADGAAAVGASFERGAARPCFACAGGSRAAARHHARRPGGRDRGAAGICRAVPRSAALCPRAGPARRSAVALQPDAAGGGLECLCGGAVTLGLGGDVAGQ